MKECKRCKRTLLFSFFQKEQSNKDGLRRHCRECRKKESQNYWKRNKSWIRQGKRDKYKEIKLEIFSRYGSRCLICGFGDWRALQIDHVNGKGNQHRFSKGMSGLYYYKSILEGKKGDYQLLCANCNWIKRYEKKEHN